MNNSNSELGLNLQKLFYDKLSEDFSNHKETSALYEYMFSNYENKNASNTIALRTMINIMQEELQPLTSKVSAKKKTVVEITELSTSLNRIHLVTHTPNWISDFNERTKISYKEKQETINASYQFHSDFPVLLRYLNYKVDNLKVKVFYEKEQSAKYKLNREDCSLTLEELSLLLNAFLRCDTLSRCYDFLSKLNQKNIKSSQSKSTNDTTKVNQYLQLLELMYNRELITANELFQAASVTSIQTDIFNFISTIEEDFCLPIIVDKDTNSCALLYSQPKTSLTKKLSIDNLIPDSTQARKSSFVKKVTFYHWELNDTGNLEYCAFDGPTFTQKHFEDIKVEFQSCCQSAQDCFKEYNKSLLKQTKHPLLRQYQDFLPEKDSNVNEEAASSNYNAVRKWL